jgi:hypothetical protein
MPIKNYSNGDIPRLIAYDPYATLGGNVICEVVNDMVSINLLPNELPTNIKYNIGASTSYRFTITIKNITTNTKLSVKLPIDRRVFLLTNEPTATMVSLTLSAQSQTQIQIELNKEQLDANITNNLRIVLPLTVENVVEENLVAQKNSGQQPVPIEYLPQTIEVQ